MRTRYATREQLEQQERIREAVALRVGGTAIHRRGQRVNTVFVVPGTRPAQVKAWADIRCRTKTYYDRDFEQHSLMLDRLTWNELMGGIPRHPTEPIYIVLALPDQTYWTQVGEKLEKLIRIGKGGRTDRNDPEDQEECVFIPMSAFAPLEKSAGP